MLVLRRHHPDVEHWSLLVSRFQQLLCPDTNIDYWLQIMWGESQGNPKARNTKVYPDPLLQASGLFQLLPKYFESWRRQAFEALEAAGYSRRWMHEDKDIFHPKTNIAIAMWLYTKQGYGAWSAAGRFPVKLYDDTVFWHKDGYIRLSDQYRTGAPPLWPK